MQKCYYIFNDIGDVIAIFKDEEFARNYLASMLMDSNHCNIGVVPDNIFRFDEHDAKYYTLENSSLDEKSHYDCRRFKLYNKDENIGYCFFTDEFIPGMEQACNMIQEKK